MITFSEKYDHTSPLFKQLEILPLDQLIKYRIAVFMWKMVNNLIPPLLAHYFLKRRNTNKFHIPFPEKEYQKRCLIYTGPKLWNGVHNDLNVLPHTKTFKSRYKSFLLEELE